MDIWYSTMDLNIRWVRGNAQIALKRRMKDARTVVIILMSIILVRIIRGSVHSLRQACEE